MYEVPEPEKFETVALVALTLAAVKLDVDEETVAATTIGLSLVCPGDCVEFDASVTDGPVSAAAIVGTTPDMMPPTSPAMASRAAAFLTFGNAYIEIDEVKKICNRNSPAST